MLGVGRDATPAQIRSAFRRMVRAHHPDTSTSGSADALAPINEAWRVLGNPALRRAYDRSLDPMSGPAAVDAAEPFAPVVSVPLLPAKFPWRFMAGMTAVGVAIALLGVFTYKPSKPPPPDNVLQAGSCVKITPNGDASEVNCEDDHDGVVDSMITSGQVCPVPLEPHRDQQGLGVFCIRLKP